MKNLFLVRIVVHFTKSKVRNRRFKNIWIFFSYVFVLSNFYRTFILIFLQMIRLYFSIIVSRFWKFSSHRSRYLSSIHSIDIFITFAFLLFLPSQPLCLACFHPLPFISRSKTVRNDDRLLLPLIDPLTHKFKLPPFLLKRSIRF